MTILCEPDAQTAEVLLTALDDSVHTVSDLPTAALTISLGGSEDVVVLGSELALDDVLSFAGEVRVQRPDVRLILLRSRVDDGVLARAADAGIKAVVSGGDNQQLRDAYKAARRGNKGVTDASPDVGEQAPPPSAGAPPGPVAPKMAVDPTSQGAPATAPGPPPQRGRVITVFSAKGGSGRTTIATNLAAALNDKGRRRVCVLDLDLAFGDVAISLSLAPSRTIVDAVQPSFRGTPDEHLNALLTQYSENFDCILAPVIPGDDSAVPVGLVQFVIRHMALRYDFVIIDTPARFSQHVITALDESDTHLLITTPSIPALKNLRLTLDLLDILGYPPSARLTLVNAADDKLGVSDDDIATTMRGTVAGTLPYSKDVAVAVNAGRPLTVSKPDHPYSQAVRRLAEDVLVGGQAGSSKRRFGRRVNKARNTG